MANSDCKQFLQHVLPRTGPYCIFGLSTDNKRKWNRGVATIDAAVSAAQDIDERHGLNAYVAVGALIERESTTIDNDTGNPVSRTSREAENIRGMRAYTMDLDAGKHFKTGKMREFETTEDALAALQRFIAHYSLPQPTLVQSGQGVHVWWTLSDEVTSETWARNGSRLHDMALAIGFKIDGGLTTIVTSVLRIAGRRNHKYAEKPVVNVLQWGTDTPTEEFHALLQDVEVPADAKPAKTPKPAKAEMPGLDGGPKIALPGKNIVKFYTPNLVRDKLDANCQAWYWATNEQAQRDDHVEEPIWRCALQTGVHVEGRKTAHEISHLDPRYDAEDTDDKLVSTKIMDEAGNIVMGPAECSTWKAAYKQAQGAVNICEGCPHEGKIVSPAVVAHPDDHIPELPPNKVEVLNTETGAVHEEVVQEPPKPFVRTPHGITHRVWNDKTEETEDTLICPLDMYPKRLQANEEGKEFGVVWMVNYPHKGWLERHIEHVGTQSLRVTLMKWGIQVPPRYIEKMAEFMSAYTDRLQKKIPTEVEFSKCGWRDNGFVLGNMLINNNGIIETHAMSEALKRSVGWLGRQGDRDLYIKALHPYGRPGLFEFREFMYITLASIFYCFSGERATTFNASGISGVGKSTIMKVAAAMFGDWNGGLIREFTRLAVERIAGHLNHVPLLLDEVTSKKDDEYAEFLFQYSGGKGKVKLTRDSQLRDDCPTWSNICMTNSNNDVYAGVMSMVKDMQAHLARVLQIEFPKTDAISKEEADGITTSITENYGHLIVDLLQWAVPHRKEHADAIERIKREIQKRVAGDLSLERFKIAEIACAIYAMETAYGLGYFLSWPIGEDREAMIAQLLTVRKEIKSMELKPEDYIGMFFDEHAGSNTLVLNAKASGNIDNVVQPPRGELLIRKEHDNKIAYVSREAFGAWCKKNGVIMKRALADLMRVGIIKRDLVKRTLGSGTAWAGGQISTFEVDMNRLDGTPTAVLSTPPGVQAAPPKAASI